MREILFRGRRSEDCSWVYGSYTEDHGGISMICKGAYKAKFEVDRETIGQYTGLKDKNGTRIFEGDVVERDGKKYHKHTVVSYNEKYCSFHLCRIGYGGGKTENLYQGIRKRITVTGNIHEKEATK